MNTTYTSVDDTVKLSSLAAGDAFLHAGHVWMKGEAKLNTVGDGKIRCIDLADGGIFGVRADAPVIRMHCRGFEKYTGNNVEHPQAKLVDAIAAIVSSVRALNKLHSKAMCAAADSDGGVYIFSGDVISVSDERWCCDGSTECYGRIGTVPAALVANGAWEKAIYNFKLPD